LVYSHTHYGTDNSKLVSSTNSMYFPLERETVGYQFLTDSLFTVCNRFDLGTLHLQGKGTQNHTIIG